jgi:transcriptional regulator GlxA family with amidase domain
MDNMCKNPAMPVHKVAVLALPHVMAYELGLPHKFLGGAVDDDGRRLYDVCTFTVDGAPVRTSAGYSVLPEHDARVLGDADTVVVPGIVGGSVVRDGTLSPEIRAALDGVRARLVSICTGSFLLAALGRLDGRPATTHWMHVDRFRALFPAVRLDPDVLYVDDGDVLTSAGNAAGIDLLLHLLRRDHGVSVANRVARRSVVAPWRNGGQSQFAQHEAVPPPQHDDTDTGPTRSWALARLAEPLTLDRLAAQAAMSVRTFTRRFREETGQSPLRWLAAQRVERARRLLETTDLSVERVAADAGFGTATSLRQHLHATIGVAPLAYRRTYRGTATAVRG